MTLMRIAYAQNGTGLTINAPLTFLQKLNVYVNALHLGFVFRGVGYAVLVMERAFTVLWAIKRIFIEFCGIKFYFRHQNLVGFLALLPAWFARLAYYQKT